jgi:hypothetical protein
LPDCFCVQRHALPHGDRVRSPGARTLSIRVSAGDSSAPHAGHILTLPTGSRGDAASSRRTKGPLRTMGPERRSWATRRRMHDDGEPAIRGGQQEKRVVARCGLQRQQRDRARHSSFIVSSSSCGLRLDDRSMPLHRTAIAKIACARQKAAGRLTSLVNDKRIQAQSFRAPDTSRAFSDERGVLENGVLENEVLERDVLEHRLAESVGGSIENRGIDVLHVEARDRDLGGAKRDLRGAICDAPPASTSLASTPAALHLAPRSGSVVRHRGYSRPVVSCNELA